MALWTSLATAVSQLQPGTMNEFHGFENLAQRSRLQSFRYRLFKAWRGNVIRLDGAEEPLATRNLGEAQR